MSSLQVRLSDLITAIGTDYKAIKTLITGSAGGDLTGLTTTDKTSLVAAINEVAAESGGSVPDGSTTVKGIVELATLTEMATGTDTTRVATVEGVRQERTALKTELLGGATSAFDTLMELKTLIDAAEETSTIDALTTTVGLKANSADVYTKTELGNPDTDLAALYATAKA